MLYNSACLSIDVLLALLKKYGYHKAKEISAKLIEFYSRQNQHLEEEIEKSNEQKLMNKTSNKLTYMLGMTLRMDNADKILKYELSL